jgi:hypothetical protein
MKLFTDIPVESSERSAHFDSMLADDTRYSVVNNRYDKFDYAERSIGVPDRVAQQAPRFKRIFSKMIGDVCGDLKETR